MGRLTKAPLDAAIVKQLKADLASVEAVQAAAVRHGDAPPSRWEAEREREKGLAHFDLACWLHHHVTRDRSAETVDDRAACALRIFREGITEIGYDFYSVFRFGERNFDSLFEMGDGDEVNARLWRAARGEKVADQVWKPIAGKPGLDETLRKAGLRSPGQWAADALTQLAERVPAPAGHVYRPVEAPRDELFDRLAQVSLYLRPEGEDPRQAEQLHVEVRVQLREYPSMSATVFAHSGRNMRGESRDLFGPGELARHTRYRVPLHEVIADAEAAVREAIDLYHARFPHTAPACEDADEPEAEGVRP